MAAPDAKLPGTMPLPENGSQPPAEPVPTKPLDNILEGFGNFLKATQSVVDKVVVSPIGAVVDGTVKMAAPMAEGLGGAVKGALGQDASSRKQKQERVEQAAAVKLQSRLRGKRARASYSEARAAAVSKVMRVKGAVAASSPRIGLLLIALAILAAITAMPMAYPHNPPDSTPTARLTREPLKRQRKGRRSSRLE
jgi:hypothetical protein